MSRPAGTISRSTARVSLLLFPARLPFCNWQQQQEPRQQQQQEQVLRVGCWRIVQMLTYADEVITQKHRHHSYQKAETQQQAHALASPPSRLAR